MHFHQQTLSDFSAFTSFQTQHISRTHHINVYTGFSLNCCFFHISCHLCSSSWPMEPQSEITVPQILPYPAEALKKFLISAYRFTSIALKAVTTIAGFAFNAIRKGFTYCSRNAGIFQHHYIPFLHSLPHNPQNAFRYAAIPVSSSLIAIYHCFSHDPILHMDLLKGFHHPSPSGIS